RSASTCAFSAPPGSSRTPRGSRRRAVTSRASRPSRRRRAPRPPTRSKGALTHAETYPSGRRRQRQAGQDGGGARRSPLHPSDLQEDDPRYEELSRARREQPVKAGRHGVDRGEQADLEIEALDRGPGRREEIRLTPAGIAGRAVGKFKRSFAQQIKRTRCINDSDA